MELPMNALWTPSAERLMNAPISRFIRDINAAYGLEMQNYADLYHWSLAEPDAFWLAVWEFCGVIASERGDTVLADRGCFPGARWFPEARLNFAENLLRRGDDGTALIGLLENGTRRTLSWRALRQEVAALAAALRAAGVAPGDRVAGFLPNIPETIVAMLATASLGAVWSSCSPDFGIEGVLDRFGQIQPKVLFAADGYFYNGKRIDSRERVSAIAARLPELALLVIVPLLDTAGATHNLPESAQSYPLLLETHRGAALAFAQLPFDHPLYILYSSGTTGAPKCIVHGAGGTLLQHLKEHQLQVGLRRDDVFFYYTTCGWMMWNWLASGLASGAALLLYDGSPFVREGQLLLDAIDSESIAIFGTSAKFLAALEKSGAEPASSHRLDALRSILSTGSPLSHESFEWVYRAFKQDVCLSSISGGTDIISCFVGGCEILPVCTGQIQCPGLGMAVAIWDEDGQPLKRDKGELVCTQPFPSAPIGFWNDPDGARYRSAYFERFPGIWAHGDYAEFTAEGGVIIHGRSDAVLNPGGVRIGTAEIYRQVEQLPEILESIVIGQRWQDDVRVVLFVVLREGVRLDGDLEARIRTAIRQNTTPRHVPAKILSVPAIPRTISGKIVELAVRNIVHGEAVKNTDALANPEALEYFRERPELAE
jgi:acetoacetyl-CoA synthetase